MKEEMIRQIKSLTNPKHFQPLKSSLQTILLKNINVLYVLHLIFALFYNETRDTHLLLISFVAPWNL